MQFKANLTSKEKRAARRDYHHRSEAIHNEVEELRRKAWRQRSGDELYVVEACAIADPALTSNLGGPRMKTWQWKRE